MNTTHCPLRETEYLCMLSLPPHHLLLSSLTCIMRGMQRIPESTEGGTSPDWAEHCFSPYRGQEVCLNP